MTVAAKSLLNVETAEQVLIVPRDSIRPFKNQPRKYFDKARLEGLARSIQKVGQLVPVHVREVESSNGSAIKYELIDGQRRWHACGIAGKTKMKVIVYSVDSEDQQFTLSVITNFGRAGHDPVEIALAIQRFQKMGHSVAEIAEMCGHSEPWVYQHIKILSLDEKVLAMMSMEIPEDDRLLFSTALLVADLPKDEQYKMAQQILKKKLKHGQAKALIKKRAEKLGVTIGSKERSPNRDYRILLSLVGKLRRGIDPLLAMHQEFFDRMFQSRPGVHRENMLKDIGDAVDDLNALLGAVTRTRKIIS